MFKTNLALSQSSFTESVMFILNTPAVMLQCNREKLVQAKTEPQIIDKSIATPELLAHILISKYADHLPCTAKAWFISVVGYIYPIQPWQIGGTRVQLRFLVNRLRQLILIQPILHADETPVKVLNGYGIKRC